MKSVRDKLVGEALPYRGRFRKLKVEHEELLSGVWKTQSSAGAAVTSSAPVVLPHSRKEYAFLKPLMVHSDCTKRELNMKFITDSRTWTNKTISEEERKEIGIVYAALRTVIDSGWTEALDRNPKIKEMSFEEIIKLMLSHFLEKHPLVVQRIESLRITKEKDETILDCMHRIYMTLISQLNWTKRLSRPSSCCIFRFFCLQTHFLKSEELVSQKNEIRAKYQEFWPSCCLYTSSGK